MTEAEWLACSDPTPMLEFLNRKVSDRKLRLFAVACCRRAWHLLTDARGQRAVCIVERYSDGEASDEELRLANVAALDWCLETNHSQPAVAVHRATARIASATIRSSFYICQAAARGGYNAYLAGCVTHPPQYVEVYEKEAVRGATRAGEVESTAQASLLRDIFENPIRPASFDPAWLTCNDGVIPKIAKVIYDARSFDRMPILADALEEAGCTNVDILNHCRQPGKHVRGC
jgi:hypothetical protein